MMRTKTEFLAFASSNFYYYNTAKYISTLLFNQVRPSDPLADADKEKTDVLMYCTGGIRCDVYSTILRSTTLT